MEGFWYRDGTLPTCSWNKVFLPQYERLPQSVSFLYWRVNKLAEVLYWKWFHLIFTSLKTLHDPTLFMTEEVKDLPYFIMAQNEANNIVCNTWQFLSSSISCCLSFFNKRKWNSFVPESVSIHFKSGIVPSKKLGLFLYVSHQRNIYITASCRFPLQWSLAKTYIDLYNGCLLPKQYHNSPYKYTKEVKMSRTL